MKNIKLILATAAICMAAVSCENAKFLDRSPYTSTAPEYFYKTEAQMTMALTSAYGAMTCYSIPGTSNVYNGNYSQGLYYIMNGPSDDVVSTGTTQNEGIELEQGIFDESSPSIRNFWKTFFVGINRCNIVIDYIDNLENSTDEKKAQYLAEARFMRAFYYYHLAWTFGGVPVITSHESDGTEARKSLEEVYELILSDLDFAYANLQDGKSGLLGAASANKWTAAAYIGRICNYLASCKRYGTGKDLVAQQPLNDFSFVDADAMTTKAKAALEDVVLNSPYTLNSDYRLNFLELSKSEQYKECLFLAEQPLSGTTGNWPASYYLPTPAAASSTVYPGSQNRHMPTTRIFYSYVKEDARRDWNVTGRYNEGYEEFILDGHSYAQPNTQDSLTADGIKVPYPYYDAPGQSYSPASYYKCCTGKFRLANVDEVSHNLHQHALSYPLMRLADVYLMYAEALYFSGNESEGREWMNKVLERSATDEENYSYLLDKYHEDDFVDELLNNRLRELFMEGSRKFDLIRFNRIDDAMAGINLTKYDGQFIPDLEDKYMTRSTSYTKILEELQSNWMSFKIWLPLSEQQIGVNPALKQNAGWGSSSN